MRESTLSALPPVAYCDSGAGSCYFLIASLILAADLGGPRPWGIMAALLQFAGVDVAIMVTIYRVALGLAKMISPTSIVVMTQTSAARLSYGDWGEARCSHRGSLVPGVLRSLTAVML